MCCHGFEASWKDALYMVKFLVVQASLCTLSFVN